jgi:Mitochondrial degradasome RNA helicase subunit C terminal
MAPPSVTHSIFMMTGRTAIPRGDDDNAPARYCSRHQSGLAPALHARDEVDGHSRLEAMEQALRACTLWLWLDLRFPGAYVIQAP